MGGVWEHMEVKINSYIVCTKRQTRDGYSKATSNIFEVAGIAQSEYELQQLTSRITKGGAHAYVIPCMDIFPITHIGLNVHITNI